VGAQPVDPAIADAALTDTLSKSASRCSRRGYSLLRIWLAYTSGDRTGAPFQLAF